jgi:DUF2917 family protein
MAASFDAPIYLKTGETLPIAEGAGFRVRCIRGHLWITQHGDLEDRVIGNGQSLVLNRPGLSLVTALGEPAVVFVKPGSVIARRPLQHAA